MSDVIEVVGLDKVLRPLERLGNLEAMRDTMRQATEIVRRKVATEPGPPPKRDRWWFGSQRKRAWWFATHKPYRHDARSNYQRTHALSGGWHSTITQDAAALEGHVTNTVDYAPWVQAKAAVNGLGPQARIHQKRWITEEAAVAATQHNVNAMFAAAAERWLEGS